MLSLIFLVSWRSVCLVNLICKNPSRSLLYVSSNNTGVACGYICLTVEPTLGTRGEELCNCNAPDVITDDLKVGRCCNDHQGLPITRGLWKQRSL